MRKFRFPKLKLIGANTKVLAGPLLAIIAISGLFFFVANLSYDRIKAKLQELETVQKAEKGFQEKANILKQIQVGVLENTHKSVTALPEDNPGPLVISLVKAYAQKNNLSLSKFQFGEYADFEGDVKKFQLVTSGKNIQDKKTLIDYIYFFSKTAPLSTVDQVNIKSSEDGLAFELKTSHYWAEFPKEIGAIGESVKDLTAEEKELLSEISQYSVPTFTVLEPAQPLPRSNPFD